jgi:hypothetical protein
VLPGRAARGDARPGGMHGVTAWADCEGGAPGVTRLASSAQAVCSGGR